MRHTLTQEREAEMSKRYTFQIVSVQAGHVYQSNQSWGTERGAKVAGNRYIITHRFSYTDCITLVGEAL